MKSEPTQQSVASVQDAHVQWGPKVGLAGCTVDVPTGMITGLFGLNGSGKTTLLRVLTGQQTLDSGQVHAARTVLVGNRDEIPPVVAAQVPQFHRVCRPAWNEARYVELITAMAVPDKTPFPKLSQGQQAAVMFAAGCAAQAEVTLFDEVHLGMDATTRQFMLDTILAESARRGGSYLISSHLVDELDGIVSHAIVLDNGRSVYVGDCDQLRESFAVIHGPHQAVADVTSGYPVVLNQDQGPEQQVVCYLANGTDRTALHRSAQAAQVTMTHPSLADTSVYARALPELKVG